jgi:hypothetical protein
LQKDQIKIIRREFKKTTKKEIEFQRKKDLIFKLIKNLHHFFPDLFNRLKEINDFRIMPIYSIEEIVFAGIAVHIFKAGSRNAFNNLNQGQFAKNFYKAFKFHLPHLDTVDLVIRNVSTTELEKLKTHLVRPLIEKKVFNKYKIFGQLYNISVDGTGVMTIDKANIKNFPNALFKIYNKGKENEKIVYFLNVLEAKLVCSNGFCISLTTEWIENSNVEYEKQDCELKAFKRLADKLKRDFPRLPICIVGDGLYPCKTIFEICKKNRWEWIFTFKSGNLTSVWAKVKFLAKLQANNQKIIKSSTVQKDNNHNLIELDVVKIYSWITSIDYCEYQVHWCKQVEAVGGEIKHTFIYLSSICPTNKNIEEIITNGRLRFKIENEGFNTQKNLGYGLQHKYSETSEIATKNYYICIQIGHLINQFFELQIKVKESLKGRATLKNLWIFFIGLFTFETLEKEKINEYLNSKIQVRF